MSQSILLVGLMSEPNEINLLWNDHNNIRHGSIVEVDVEGSDRQRELKIRVNGAVVASVPCSEMTKVLAAHIRELVGK